MVSIPHENGTHISPLYDTTFSSSLGYPEQSLVPLL